MSEGIPVRAVNPGVGYLKSGITGRDPVRVGIRDRGDVIEIGFFGKKGGTKLPERATLDGKLVRIISIAPRVPDNQVPTGMPRSYVIIAEREGDA